MSDAQVTPPVSGDAPSDTGKILALFGWLTGVVAVIAILIEPYKTEKFVRHHAIQAIGLWIVACVGSLVLGITIIGSFLIPILMLAVYVVAIIGAVKSFQGQYWEAPVVYGLVKKYL